MPSVLIVFVAVALLEDFEEEPELPLLPAPAPAPGEFPPDPAAGPNKLALWSGTGVVAGLAERLFDAGY